MFTVEELLEKHRKENKSYVAEKITFEGVDNLDIYNITAPFKSAGNWYIAGRVEPRDSEHSKVYFFKQKTDTQWIVAEGAPVFDLQDPFITHVNGSLIFGGVEIFESEEDPSVLHWRTVFYTGKDIFSLSRFFAGPMGMKDIRLKQLADNRLLVLTRPQGEKGGRGKIGAVVVESLDDLTINVIEEAPLLKGLFIDEEWGGANEIHHIEEESKEVGVLGHIACFGEEGDRHYYGMSFILNIENLQLSDVKIIAERKDFLPGPSKRPDLEDVIFSGGLSKKSGETYLYAGVSDAQAQRLKIENPFKVGEGEKA